jgi:lysozyme family protein
MTPLFLPAFKKLLKWEGGKSDDPADPGGRTNFGITQKAWDDFAKSHTHDVWNLTESAAEFFYEQEYWRPMRLSLCGHQCLADTLLSFAVNQGKKTAARRLQKVLGVVQDGVLGPQSFLSLSRANSLKVNEEFLDETGLFYGRLIARRPQLIKFAKGWYARVGDYRVEE